ncbi:MAG: membrane protein insertion efficiency factor YidD [Actinobacteria bacterium]|nr:membrane protein insertion efficiency factor YidD [Actinomycetota bacterium]
MSAGRAIGPGARAALAVIRFYRSFISPAFPPSCRFTPSCSAYAAEAIERFGLARGSYLALRRLLRCHPWHRGGHDPVPPLVPETDRRPVVPRRGQDRPRVAGG